MFEILLTRERTQEFDISLYGEDGETGATIDTGDTVRLLIYRRSSSTPLINLLSGAAATANGSSLTVTTTVPTPSGTIPVVRLHLGEGDLAALVPGAPYVVEINLLDNNGSPTDALTGPIKGIAYTADASQAVP